MAARNTPSRGAKSDKLWRDAIHRAVKRRREGRGDAQALEKLADALVDAGLAGDVSALKEIGDRLDGKPRQEVELSGDADAPVYVMLAPPKPKDFDEWERQHGSAKP